MCIGTIAKPIIMYRGKEHRRPLLRGTLAKKKSGSGSVRSLPRADRLDIRRLVWKFVEKTESIESSLRGPLPRPGTLSKRNGLSCQQDQIVSSVEAWCTKTLVTSDNGRWYGDIICFRYQRHRLFGDEATSSRRPLLFSTLLNSTIVVGLHRKSGMEREISLTNFINDRHCHILWYNIDSFVSYGDEAHQESADERRSIALVRPFLRASFHRMTAFTNLANVITNIFPGELEAFKQSPIVEGKNKISTPERILVLE